MIEAPTAYCHYSGENLALVERTPPPGTLALPAVFVHADQSPCPEIVFSRDDIATTEKGA